MPDLGCHVDFTACRTWSTQILVLLFCKPQFPALLLFLPPLCPVGRNLWRDDSYLSLQVVVLLLLLLPGQGKTVVAVAMAI